MSPSESTSQTSFNPHVSLLFFHFVIEISEEVADQIIKGARQFNSERHVRDARVRDAVRERDAAQINEAVLTIVADHAERLQVLRKVEAATSRETSEVLEVVDWGIRTFGSYAGPSRNLNIPHLSEASDFFGDRLGRHQSNGNANNGPPALYLVVGSIIVHSDGYRRSPTTYRFQGSQGTH